MIKVAVFEDNKSRREGLRMLIEESDDMTCVGAFEDCSKLVANLQNSGTNVVLMDIDMPNVNGIEGVKLIRQHFPQMLILMQTVFEDDDKVFASVCAGANGYLLKKTSPEKLITSIRSVIEGEVPMTPVIAKKVLEMFRKQSSQNTQQFFNLSAREKEILTLLVKGMSYKMIAAHCEISFNTVSTHMHKIYEKLHVHSATEAVIMAIEQKIV